MSNYIKFNDVEFVKDLRQELRLAFNEIAELLRDTAKRNAASLQMHDTPVRVGRGIQKVGGRVKFVGETYTTDAERQSALVNSIIDERIKISEGSTFKQIISAMKSNATFRDSHIGFYYEFGTGEAYEPDPQMPEEPYPNPDRHGKAIVTRSKKVSYGLGIPGAWYDLGGNLRLTKSPLAGQRGEGLMQYIGGNVEAEHWFSRAADEVRNKVPGIIQEHLENVNPANYLEVAKEIHLGNKYRR